MPRKTRGKQVGSVCCHCPPPCCESSRMLGPCITHLAQDKRASALNCASTACSGASFSCLHCSGEWLEGDRASARSVVETNLGLVGKRKAEVSLEAARIRLWGATGNRAGDSEQGPVWEALGSGTHGSQHHPHASSWNTHAPETSSRGHFPVGVFPSVFLQGPLRGWQHGSGKD